ncbi:hypothetical protein [Streptomyces europaeiscabiei]|uniref:hypothetical protein n=1 Tax=Streptomyces europaeiscabiei TaxID=146819 RepID=UPI0029A57DC7|nr:hypothetical protein [Streptomyces europaeiscabiei]MDX2771224.1 hypothetical protein [Streptomyces europaeiscabiei]
MSKVWQGHVIDGTRFVVPASGVTPRHVLCAVGVGLDPDVLSRVVDEAGGGDFELDEFQREPDPRMREAFEAAVGAREATNDDEFGEDDWAAVDAHDSVAYVLSPPISQANALDVSRRALAVTAALLANGATAVKNESSGVACGREQWLALASEAAAAETADDLVGALVRAWVVPVAYDGEMYFSCGMHLLGEADVELVSTATAEPELELLLEWMTTMKIASYYLLTEQPEHGIQDGEGFRIAQDAPRWIMNRMECERFEDDDFFHNPYGYWRLTPAVRGPRRGARLRRRNPRTTLRTRRKG